MKQLIPLTLVISIHIFPVHAQQYSQYQTFVEVGGMAASTDRTPFWLRANQFGIVPYAAPIGTIRTGISGSILLTDTLYKPYRRAWSFHYGAEVVANAGKENQLLAPEYYLKLAHRQIQLVVGRRREVIGLVDTTLSSGSYAWSGNALPIPKILFGTKGFAPLGRRQWLAINAFIAHGWFADTPFMQHSYLHQKSVFFRIGKPQAAVRGYVGLNHHVQWAGRSDSLDYHYAVNGQLPNQLADFPNVLFAIRTNGLNNPRITSFDYANLYGNHVGSVDFGLEVRLPSAHLLLYHQHSYDTADGVLMKNLPDGLTGIRYRPLRKGTAGFQVNALLVEFLSTLYQGGPIFAPWNGLHGNQNYFNNGQYREGWVYRDHILGTPFITRGQDVQAAYQSTANQAINNNRVQMAHVGLQATLGRKVNLVAKLSYSRNYGLYGSPLPGTPVQWSSLIQVSRPLSWLGGSWLSASLSADLGQLYTNSVGGQFALRKTLWHR